MENIKTQNLTKTHRKPPEYHENDAEKFRAISITGTQCELMCDHCEGELLKSMDEGPSKEAILEWGRRVADAGGRGILMSGGSDDTGRVPFTEQHFEAMSELKEMGLDVIVHTGLLKDGEAERLAEAGVDMALFDMIGSDRTIAQLYHLDRTVEDYVDTLQALKGAGLEMGPHVVIGHHYGEIDGEYHALRELVEAEPEAIVFVVLNPMFDTPMEDAEPPDPEDVARIVAMGRVLAPETRITLGCAKPAGEYCREVERLAFDAGANVISYPLDETVDYVEENGFDHEFRDACCCLL